ncbi:hypothetical protein SAMN04487843_101375 [Methylobacterium sp. ap11]|uniref:hypothetical protein n=1 Tax=Methylobacterium sp. ap11 TaxID=1761799 RepID=UPI0008B3BD90|nr:hypothetical protein [Methylobacterium sp. ap11]SEO43444.1 hypothetical protein SAMN04487843_101375 [Methylobacterium sp. ap11]
MVDVVKWAVRVGCLKVEGAVLDRVEYNPTSVVAVLHLYSAAAPKPKAKPVAPDARRPTDGP